LNDEKEAYRFGRLALELNSRAGREAIPAAIMVVHCYLSHLRLPASASLEPFLSGYRISLETGDLAMGTIDLCNYHWVYQFCGLPLNPFVLDLQKYLAELRLCQQSFLLPFLLPDLHLALNLTGQTEDPSTISWDSIRDPDHFLYYTNVVAERHPAELKLHYAQMFNALVLGDTEKVQLALDRVLSRKRFYRRFDGTHLCNLFFTFYDGLASAALVRKGRKRRRYIRLMKESIKWLMTKSKAGSINCVGMIYFLKAEQQSLNSLDDKELVRSLYGKAIVQLTKTGFMHYSAMANERLGQVMLEKGDQDWGEHYLSQAATLYHDWGASVKVEQLLTTYPFAKLDDRKSNHGDSFVVRARARYDSQLDSLAAVSRENSSMGFSSELN